MESGGYSGIAFTRTRRAVLFLTNGRTVTVAAAQAERLLEDRAQADDLPPIPVVPLPEDLVLDAEPGLPIEEGEPRQLPSSVIAEPLVLWATSGSSLSCERLIPYKDGFEIELLAKGAALQAVGESPARSPRGFGRWRGLQPTVRFSDGRRQRIEDLTSGDREAPVIVSPFMRPGSGPDVLWVLVMPLPPGGPVRLEVTWRSRGIEGAGVEFEGSLLRAG